MRVRLTLRARREANRCDAWWRAHRLASPELFEREFARVLKQLETAPRSGALYTTASSRREYRRILMPETRYYVYYLLTGPDDVRVDAVWSTLRGQEPAL